MPDRDQVIAAVTARLDESVSVVVGRKGAEGGLDAAKVALADDAAEAFRGLARDCVDGLRVREPVPYTSEAELGRDEVFVLDDPDDLAELAGLSALAHLAATLPVTPPRRLDVRIQLYAVVLGDTDRVVLVRRADPRLAHRRGHWLAVARERLARLDEPAFAFSPGFDFVLGPSWAVVLEQAPFERLFREVGLVDEHVRDWVAAITDHLPMAPGAEAELLRVARRDPRTWRRLREIRRRGHLARVTLSDVRTYAKAVGLDPATVVRDDRLVFDPAERFSFLHLLNEDLYRGELTETAFEAHRKAAADG